MSVKVILRENNITVHQMMMPRKTPVISVPFIKAIRASMFNSLTVNDWAQDIDEDFISTKEYDFSYQEGDTLFYDLIIRKESKKMKEECCDGKRINKIVLAGFKSGEYRLTYITSFSNTKDPEGDTEYLLDKADKNRSAYKAMFILYFDIDLKIIDQKNICFEEVVVKATLC